MPVAKRRIRRIPRACSGWVSEFETFLLIFTMLGEASTTRIARKKDAQGFNENKIAAKEGGSVAGIAREELEKRSGEAVVSPENYLEEPESVKRKKLPEKL